MNFEIQRETFLSLLQRVIGVVERRQTLPILSNVLVAAEDNRLSLMATDLEVELATHSELTELIIAEFGRTTLPARKLLDILRALPEGAGVTLSADGDKAILKSGRSRFSLATLPADELPTLEDFAAEVELRLPQATLKTLIERSQFAMAQQDVRYYLNGLLLELQQGRMRSVATDGHRLAWCEREVHSEAAIDKQVIVPRKGIQELTRLLADDEAEINVKLGNNHINIDLGSVRFTSKLIDGRFPDYQRAIPRQSERKVIADRQILRNALARAAILANENRGVGLQLENDLLRIYANNPEQEKAEDEIEVSYQGEPLEIGFNVAYLLDVLNVLPGQLVELFFIDTGSSCLLREADDEQGKYVISPMRL